MDIAQSLERILHAKAIVGRRFYERFLKKHEELRPFFSKVDMKRQGILLTTSLMVIVRHYSNPTPAVDLYLRYLGTKHNEMNIPRTEYPKWTETLMETLSDFHGDDWSAAVEQEWREAIGQTTELMFAGYDERVTV